MTDPKENVKRTMPKYLRFTSMGIQMGGIIAFFAWLGNYLDEKYHSETPWWTIGLCLFGVAGALTIVIRDVLKMVNEDEK